MTNVFQRPAYRRLLLVLRRLGYAEDTLNLVEAAFVRLGAGRSDGTAFKPRPPAQRDQRSRWQWQSQIAARRERRFLRRALAAHWQSVRGGREIGSGPPPRSYPGPSDRRTRCVPAEPVQGHELRANSRNPWRHRGERGEHACQGIGAAGPRNGRPKLAVYLGSAMPSDDRSSRQCRPLPGRGCAF